VRQPRAAADETADPAFVVRVDRDFHELLRVLDWQRAKADGVHQLKDCRVGACAERQRENRDPGEQRVAP
jgi:hypothetical protein